ncbi:hypothetical protein Acr_00g0029120 [Actinidia rufa]|uniref:Uncharacterized protein n=1 Tax=Actinidia rufa TaxID=165716 RepID=A0A7J0DFR7_9ERIC|nr:hypothetical protein Acr_00g0029120 [Actinidia rufa]
MALGDDGCSRSHSTRGEPPHVPQTPGDRGTKLLADAERTASAASKQKPVRLLPKGEDCLDITIKHLQAQLAAVTQIMIDNHLMKTPQIDGGELSRARSTGQRDPPRGSRKERAQHSSDLCEKLNAKRNRESNLREKLNDRAAATKNQNSHSNRISS